MQIERPAITIERLNEFLTMPLEEVLRRSQAADSQAAVLRHFHDVAANVPAYARFLR